jgi:hypothetical protein
MLKAEWLSSAVSDHWRNQRLFQPTTANLGGTTAWCAKRRGKAVRSDYSANEAAPPNRLAIAAPIPVKVRRIAFPPIEFEQKNRMAVGLRVAASRSCHRDILCVV